MKAVQKEDGTGAPPTLVGNTWSSGGNSTLARLPVPVKKGKTLDAPGSVSGDVELEQLVTSLVLLSFSKLVVDQAFACMPSPVGRPALSDLDERPSLPSPLRLPRADFALKDAIILAASFPVAFLSSLRLSLSFLPPRSSDSRLPVLAKKTI